MYHTRNISNQCISYAYFLSKVLPFTQTFQTLLSMILMCRSLIVLGGMPGTLSVLDIYVLDQKLKSVSTKV